MSDNTMSRVVCLNVGGVPFYTTSATLERENSYFKGLVSFSSWADSCKADDTSPPCYFIDRDPTHFRYILNWLRGVYYLPDDEGIISELAYEADYYSLSSMADALAGAMKKTSPFSMKRSLGKIAHELGTRGS